jgi:uncharacterized membrane protein
MYRLGCNHQITRARDADVRSKVVLRSCPPAPTVTWQVYPPPPSCLKGIRRYRKIDGFRRSGNVNVTRCLLPLHIVAGGLAVVIGGVALAVSKGGTLHRRSGLLFVYAMLTMGISGSILALRQSLTNANVLGGFMSAYFVVTALTTVRPVSAWTRRLNLVALAIAIALSLIDTYLGFIAFRSPGHAIDGVPFFMPFFIAVVLALAAAGDLRAMRPGMLRAGKRLAPNGDLGSLLPNL